MATVQELHDAIRTGFKDITFAQRVDTAVTGLGLSGLGVVFLVQIYVLGTYHETEMRQLQGMQINQIQHVERQTNREDLIGNEMKRLNQPKRSE